MRADAGGAGQAAGPSRANEISMIMSCTAGQVARLATYHIKRNAFGEGIGPILGDPLRQAVTDIGELACVLAMLVLLNNAANRVRPAPRVNPVQDHFRNRRLAHCAFAARFEIERFRQAFPARFDTLHRAQRDVITGGWAVGIKQSEIADIDLFADLVGKRSFGSTGPRTSETVPGP